MVMRSRHLAVPALVFALAVPAMPRAARANEVALYVSARGFVIHEPAEVLDRYCARDDSGALWLTLPGGARFELVTLTSDPAITNPGDGSFHPFDPAEVRSALQSVRFPVTSVSAEVFLLPYPRRNGLESAAGPELILLSPGVRPLSREHQHAEFDHELWHVVQYAVRPDAGRPRW